MQKGKGKKPKSMVPSATSLWIKTSPFSTTGKTSKAIVGSLENTTNVLVIISYQLTSTVSLT